MKLPLVDPSKQFTLAEDTKSLNSCAEMGQFALRSSQILAEQDLGRNVCNRSLERFGVASVCRVSRLAIGGRLDHCDDTIVHGPVIQLT